MKNKKKQKGSVALEQILFIGAVVLLSGGIYVFYGQMKTYLEDLNIAAIPTQISTGPGAN